MEHFLIPWSLMRVLADNTCYPLILALPVVGLSPFPRFWRVSPFLAAYLSLAANVFLAAHAITACTLGIMVTPLPCRTSEFLSILLRQSRVFSEAKLRGMSVLFSPFSTSHLWLLGKADWGEPGGFLWSGASTIPTSRRLTCI